MSFDERTLQTLAQHEQQVLAEYDELLGWEREIYVQPPGGAGGGAATVLARLQNYYWLDSPVMRVGFLGYFVSAIGAPVPDPLPELTVFMVWAYPALTVQRDLYYCTPKIPFETPGESDVEVVQVPVQAGGTEWRVREIFRRICF